jgi:hypothetical protein
LPIIRLTNFTCLYGGLAPGRFGSLTIHGSTKGVRSVFNILLFLYLFDEKWETKKEPDWEIRVCFVHFLHPSIKIIKKEQAEARKPERALALSVFSLASYSRV